MSNFSFLETKKEYELFGPACIEAENIYASSPTMCAIGCRKALELAVGWMYRADPSLGVPEKENLNSLLEEKKFCSNVLEEIRVNLLFINRLGNRAVHTNEKIQASDVRLALKWVFIFVQWIDYRYGADYQQRIFDEKLIPTEKVLVDIQKVKEQESLLEEKNTKIKELYEHIEQMSAQYAAEKEKNKEDRSFPWEELSEFETRKRYIDLDLESMGWKLDGPEADVKEEYLVEGMRGEEGTKGYCDYVLFGKDGRPLAVVEAKRSAKEPQNGRTQVKLYADCLERQFGVRPLMFVTNGVETYFWDDQSGPMRQVDRVFSKDDLQKLINRRAERQDLMKISIDDRITDRYYQKAAIRAVCEQIMEKRRKHLLVMATGTGKTRTAASLVDVLSRGKWVTNILFLADRTALVKQAKDDFKNYLPDLSLCNLCNNKDDWNARIVFSTYPTILNAIEDETSKSTKFTPAHFDLIIIDESHRSIFKKYRDIFKYFDALLVGLTATPKTDVDRNTYDFFEREPGDPTYVYEYTKAVYEDHVLVPYYNYEVKTKFLEEGIYYDDLSDEDKERYEDDFTEDGEMPESIRAEALNKYVFNEKTVDMVLQDLMERGIKVAGGDRLGKSIIFARNKRHAEFILERFNKLYSKYCGNFAQRVICDDSYAQTIIDDFKQPEKNPHIVVSVDMMDTGIDVPECVNLVFFKKVCSKTKFWQMIGRGTRLCKGLCCKDPIDGEYTDKRRFLIFDYCGNFEFFREHVNGYKSQSTKSLSENIFCKQVKIVKALQASAFAGDKYQEWRNEIIEGCQKQVEELNPELISVRSQRLYVEKYKKEGAFDSLDEGTQGELLEKIAPLVSLNESDEWAKRFDDLMYRLILNHIEKVSDFQKDKNTLCEFASSLEDKANIPFIKEKLPLIQEIQTEEFWEANDILSFDMVRKELRGLIKFIAQERETQKNIITRLEDSVTDSQGGRRLEEPDDFESYRERVTRYVKEHKDNMMAIYKLTNNMPLDEVDYRELERVLTSELGTKEDYEREYENISFGLLIRKIVGLNHEAVMQAFSNFINDHSLTQEQITFVEKIIRHIEENGYLERKKLQEPPFDRPISFIKMFDEETCRKLIETIDQIQKNAESNVAS